jgi:hypothetical protein
MLVNFSDDFSIITITKPGPGGLIVLTGNELADIMGVMRDNIDADGEEMALLRLANTCRTTAALPEAGWQ